MADPVVLKPVDFNPFTTQPPKVALTDTELAADAADARLPSSKDELLREMGRKDLAPGARAILEQHYKATFGEDPAVNRGTQIAGERRRPKPVFPLEGEQKPAVSLKPVDFDPFAGSDTGVTVGDFAKSGAAGALSGTGMIAQGGGELLARGINLVGDKLGFDPQARAVNPLQGWVNDLLNARSPAAKKAEANSQISGELLKPSTWNAGNDPSVAGIALQGMNAIGQFAPNLGVALVTAGASIPAQLAIGATVGGLQALGGGAQDEREAINKMTHQQLLEGSKLYGELIDRGVPQGQAKEAVAEAAALGGGLGNAIPSAGEGAFENFLIGMLTRGKVRIPSLGAGAAGRVATGALGGAAMGGTEEAVEQAGQNVGSNVAIGGNRPIGADTLQQFVMGMIAEGAAGGGAGALSKAPTTAPAAAAAPASQVAPGGPAPAVAPSQAPVAAESAPTPAAQPSLSPIDQARADAQVLKSGGDLPGAEETRTKNATLVAVYGENAAVRHVIDAPGQFSAIGDAMLMAAPTVERVRATLQQGQESRDITPDILGAIDELAKIKASGQSVAQIMASGVGHEVSFEGQQLIQFLDENAGNPKRIAAFLESYLQEVENATGVPSKVRGRAFDIIQEQHAARKKADADKALEQVAQADKADDEKLKKVRREVGLIRAETALADLKSKAAKPAGQTAMEAAFERAKTLKGTTREKPRPPSDGAVPAGKAAHPAPGPAKGAGPAARGAGAVSQHPQVDHRSESRPVRAGSDRPGAGEGALNRGAQIADELTKGEGTRENPVIASRPKHINRAAARAAEQPSAAQKGADNYAKGHFKFAEPHQLSKLGVISIETAKGRERVAKDGSWSVPNMPAHYGHLSIAEGNDGDKADVTIGDDLNAKHVYVIDQIDPETKKYDETKSMVGFSSQKAAEAVYAKSFTDGKGKARIGAITEMTPAQYVARAQSNGLKDAVAYEDPNAPLRVPPDTHDMLRLMAENSGWAEQGGQMVRTAVPQGGLAAGGRAEDEITRTQWLGKPDWAKASKGANMTVAEIKAAVDKAISGKPLTDRQRTMVEGMLADIADTKALLHDDVVDADLTAEGLAPSPNESEIVDLMASAVQKDEGAAERAAIQYDGDDVALIQALKEIIRAAPNEKPEAARGGEEGGRPALELQGQTPAEVAAQAAQAAAQAAQAAAESVKAAVDEMRGAFTLTGSNRAADEGAARGQRDLLSEVQSKNISDVVDIAGDLSATLDHVLSPAEKAEAARELGDAAWSTKTAKKFLSGYAEWLQQGAKDLGTALSRIFSKVLEAVRNGALAVAVAVNFNFAEVAKPLPVAVTKSTVKISLDRPRANFNGVEASADARLVADWFVRNQKQEGDPFIIADKPGGFLYAFDRSGALLAKSPAIFGKARGDTLTEAQAAKSVDESTDADKVTPAGIFKAQPSEAYGAPSIVLKQYADSKISIHSVYLGTPSEQRMERIQSDNPDNKRISYGCINALPEFIDKVIAPHFSGGSHVIVVPETMDVASFFGITDKQTDDRQITVNTQNAEAVSWGDDKYGREERQRPGSRGTRRRQEKTPGSDLNETPAFSRQADNIEDYKFQQKPARSGNPIFWNNDIGLAIARAEYTSDAAEGDHTVGYGIYDVKTRDADGKPVKLGTLRVDLDARGKFSALRLIEIRKEFRQQGLGWGETTIASLLQHNGATPMRIIDIQHHTGDDRDALPFWRKMGTRLDNYSTDPDVQIDGTLTRKDYLQARAEKGKFSRDARPQQASENLAPGTEPAGARAGAQGARPGESTAQQPDAAGAAGGPAGRAGAAGRDEGVGLTPSAVRQAVEPILEKWGNAPEVVVLGSMADAPEAVRSYDEGQRSQGAGGTPEAFYWGGKVYLVAGALKSPAAAQRALFHETLGHVGLRGTFGDKLNPILDRVAFDFKDRVAAKAAEYGFDVKDPDQRRQAAEEVLAELAQTRPQHGLVQRLIAAIRQFLRGIGLDLKLSDADLVSNYVAPARGFVERGRAQSALEVAPAFARQESYAIPDAAKRILLDVENGLGLFSNINVSSKAVRTATSILDGKVNPRELFAEYAHYEEQGLVQGGPKQTKVASPENRHIAKALRLIVGANDVPAFSRAAAALPSSTFASARSLFDNVTRSDRTLNRVISKFNTPFHIAETHPEFKAVYEEAQDYNQDVSRVANETADLAPDLLPRIEGFADFKKSAPSNEDIATTANALYAGTLWGGGSPLEGRVWSDEELRTGRARDGNITIHAFDPVSESQIKLYRQALASVGHSLTEHAKSLVWRLAKQKDIRLPQGLTLAQMVGVSDSLAETQIEGKRDRMKGADDETRARAEAEVAELDAFRQSLKDIQAKTEGLIQHGYFPAMRFGQYAVNVQTLDANGKWKEEFFGRYETQTAANLAKEELQREYPAATSQVTSGVMNADAHKLFQGLNLDALELFSEHMRDDSGKPISADPIMQEYFRVAVTERSTLKRQIHRKGTPGFSRDVPRALAQFTVSNATSASRNYHAADMLAKVQKIKAGDLQAYATRYVRYLQDPQEESPTLRGFLANYYILGSIAFGAVNMTQPILMTAPYLSQHTTWPKAMAQLGRAAKDLVTGRKDLTPDEQAAYARAANAGIVSPQEIHQIRAESRASMMGDSPLWQKLEAILAERGVKLPGKLLMRKAAFLWGSIYSMTEQFNRGTTFLAAYRVGKEKGEDAYTFAKNAVDATQGVYARSNRPEVSRGAVGATIMTFKQFNISYLELAKRLYDHDKKAFAVLMLTLMALAGAEGLPFAEDVEDLIDTIGQWMGYPTNSKKALRKKFVEMLGPDIADVMLHGASAIPGVPIDVANRMGMHNIIPGSAMLKTSEPDKTRDLLELLGPAASLFQNAGAAVTGLATGKPGEAKGLLPSALQNALKAAEMVDTGTYRDTKGRKVMNVDTVDAFSKLIGFQPAKVARETRLVGQNQQDIALHRVIEDSIASKWAHGTVDKDPGMVADAVRQWKDWNSTNPEMPVAITGAQIARRIKELQMSREERFIKSAPKEIRGDVARDIRQ